MNDATSSSRCPNRYGCNGGFCAAVLLSGLLASGLGGCGFAGSEEAAADGSAKKGGPPGRPPALVRVAAVQLKPVRPRVVVVGNVLPKETSIVASGADGIVEKFTVEEGQFVARGDVLSELRMVTTDLGIQEAKAVLRERKQKWDELKAGSRREEIAEAKARMAVAEVVRKNASVKLERAGRLFEQKALNRDELDDAEERSRAAEQTFLAAKAVYDRIAAGPRIEEKQQARARYEAQVEQVAFLEAEKQKRMTRAPFDGYIIKEQTFQGQWLSKGDPIVTLAMLDEVDVVANVDQWDLPHVRLGQSVEVTVRGTEPSRWRGTILSIVPRSEWQSGSRGFPVKVRLSNRFQEVAGQRLPVLKEGMMAEVTFRGSAIEAVLVPKDALVRTSRGNFVHIFTPDAKNAAMGSTVQVPVELGLSEGRWIQVHTSAGGSATPTALGPGVLVVTEGAERLRPVQQNIKIVADAKPAG